MNTRTTSILRYLLYTVCLLLLFAAAFALGQYLRTPAPQPHHHHHCDHPHCCPHHYGEQVQDK